MTNKVRDAHYMNAIQKEKYNELIENILNKLEAEALEGNNYVYYKIGDSDENKNLFDERVNIVTNKLSSMGYKVERDFEVTWRFLISNLTTWYLKISW